MTKKQYKEALKRFPELVFRTWLEILPTGEPTNVPIVLVPAAEYARIEKQINRFGFRFADSTIWYIEGHHYPKGYWDRAFVKIPT